MATAVIVSGSEPTTIDDGEAVTNWGGDTFALNSSDNIEGTNCVECVQTTNGNNDVYVTGTWDFSGTGVGDQHLRLWFLLTYVGNLSATNPIQIFLYDGTNTAYYYWDKGADYTGGWAQAVIYTGDTPDSGTVNKAAITRIGMRMVTASKPRNATWNALYDAWKYGDGYKVTGGTSGDEIDLSHIAALDKTAAYNIVTDENGVYSLRGDVQIGDGTTTTHFFMDTQVANFAPEQVNTGLYKLHGNGSGCNITIADSFVNAAGAAVKDKFDFDMSEVNLNAFTMTGSFLVNGDEVIFKSGQTAQNNVINSCGQVTHGGADMDGTTIKNYEGAANSSSLIYNVAADPSGEMDDMVFEMGTTLTHGTEWGLTSPVTINLSGVVMNGYGATNNSNDSHFHVKRTSGTVTINLSGCSTDAANFSYRTDGATVTINNSISLTFTPLIAGSDVSVFAAGTTTPLQSTDSSGTSFVASVGAGQSIDYKIYRKGYLPIEVYGVSFASTQNVIVNQQADGNYDEVD